MNCCGISLTKDLAIIAAVSGSGANGTLPSGKPVEAELYTYGDGRAFRGCPYFSYWKGTSQFFLNDAAIEEVDFARAVSDFRLRNCCEVIGFDPGQTKLVRPGAVPVEKTSTHAARALEILNGHAMRHEGYLFEPNTAMQYMWNSLPIDESGQRILPHHKISASGRYDGILAIVNAMAAGMMAEHAKADRQAKELEEKNQAVERYWESIPHNSKVWIRFFPVPGQQPRGRALLSMQEALPLLKDRCARFEGFGEQ